MQMFILDTDPGIDDAHALCMAVQARGAQLAAVTTVAGNVGVQQTTANALFLLAELAAVVPVFAGAAAPLTEPFHGAPEIHGADGLGLVQRRPVRAKAEDLTAADAIVTLARARPGEVTLVALGPLTNLALALQQAPELPDLVHRCIVMGGAIQARGNFTPVAEFNIASDPEAAKIVFSAWPGLTLVPWEAVQDMPVTETEAEQLIAGPGRAADLIRRINAAHRQNVGFLDEGGSLLFPDPAAMAVALDATCIAERVAHAIRVELSGERRGETQVDWLDNFSDLPKLEIVTRLNRDRTLELIRLTVPEMALNEVAGPVTLEHEP